MEENKRYFDETLLNDNILDALWDMHFEQCTPIQARCIDPIIEGRDIMGVAQTGTGKTAAYLLPVLSLLDDGDHKDDAVNCLIMAPTRELVQQIDQAMQGFSYYLDGISSVAIYGGNDGNRYDQELSALRKGASVIIATPGRLISHMQMGNLDLSHLSFFILDEADRMLDMGFSDDILSIAKNIGVDAKNGQKTGTHCQTIMFSATMPDNIDRLAHTLLKDPLNIRIAVSKPAEKILQSAYVCYNPQKLKILKDMHVNGFTPQLSQQVNDSTSQAPQQIHDSTSQSQQQKSEESKTASQNYGLKRAIIFSGKKQRVKEINKSLLQMKVNCGAMHSDLTQAERDDIMYRFRTGDIDVLVATDIVARGIDIDDIQIVINYDVPHDVEDYVHRIGRTARAERDGVAITLVSDDDVALFQKIEKFLEKTIVKNPLPVGVGDGPEYKAVKKTFSNNKNRRQGSNRHHHHHKPKAKKDVANGDGNAKNHHHNRRNNKKNSNKQKTEQK